MLVEGERMATDRKKSVAVSDDEDDEVMETDTKEEDVDEENEELFAAHVMADVGRISSNFCSSRSGVVGARKHRPFEEKERTKLRERHRRAITARILTGLKRHGNYNLRVRADINDVITALAREAGWIVLPDGTTFPSRSHGSGAVGGISITGTLGGSQGYQPSSECLKGNLAESTENPLFMCDTASTTIMYDKPIVGLIPKFLKHDLSGPPYVPVYVMLPQLGVINVNCQLVDPDNLLRQLRILKSINVDGIIVHCWWGIVEAHAPRDYNWNGYKKLFQMVQEAKFKLHVVMSFHECGGDIGDDACIPLPHWVAEIGRINPDIFFADRDGRHNPECLSWGIDKERALSGRTAIEVYLDYMRSFRVEFDEFFKEDTISIVEVGLGPCGELRYPSCPIKHGWRYPGIGEFQCYDQYLMKSLRKAAQARGLPFWARRPDNAGCYNSRPDETGFFCDEGDYDDHYGRFFLDWYSQVLVDHGDLLLALAKLAFEGTRIAVRFSGIHWWYKSPSHAAELTAGFYNPCNRDGYAAILVMLKKHEAILNFSSSGFHMLDQEVSFSEAQADPEGLAWQVMNSSWDSGVAFACEKAFPCHDRVSYDRVFDRVKPPNYPIQRHHLSFANVRLSAPLMEGKNFMELERFIQKMHGQAISDRV